MTRVHPFLLLFCFYLRSSIATKFAHIYRQAGSYVDPHGTPGLFFVAYAADTNLFDITLDQMMGILLSLSLILPNIRFTSGLVKPMGKPQGVDTMMEYVDVLSGQYYYIPNLTRLFKLWTA